MKTLAEIERFLEHESQGDFKSDMSKEKKVDWLLENATCAKRAVFRMRGVGKSAWNNFLWAFNLEEKVVLTRVDENSMPPDEQ